MLRKLELPPGVSGNVFLTAMPGINGDFPAEHDTIKAAGVDTVLCLTPLAENETLAWSLKAG